MCAHSYVVLKTGFVSLFYYCLAIGPQGFIDCVLVVKDPKSTELMNPVAMKALELSRSSLWHRYFTCHFICSSLFLLITDSALESTCANLFFKNANQRLFKICFSKKTNIFHRMSSWVYDRMRIRMREKIDLIFTHITVNNIDGLVYIA